MPNLMHVRTTFFPCITYTPKAHVMYMYIYQYLTRS